MHLTLHNYWRSSASYRIRIALALKELPYEYIGVSIQTGIDAQHEEAYRKLNPQARVPTLQANGQVLTQSMAILEWLDEVVPNPPLLPTDAFERAQVRALAQIIVADIQPLQNIAVTRHLATIGLDNKVITDWVKHWITRGLRVFEHQLTYATPGVFCHRDSPSLADICLIPQCYAARRFGVDLESFPTLLAIEQHCLAQDAFKRAAPENQPDAEVPI
jgi:maleylacetoacetate isomerase